MKGDKPFLPFSKTAFIGLAVSAPMILSCGFIVLYMDFDNHAKIWNPWQFVHKLAMTWTYSVLTAPGQRETMATPLFFSSKPQSAAIRSQAAFPGKNANVELNFHIWPYFYVHFSQRSTSSLHFYKKKCFTHSISHIEEVFEATNGRDIHNEALWLHCVIYLDPVFFVLLLFFIIFVLFLLIDIVIVLFLLFVIDLSVLYHQPTG